MPLRRSSLARRIAYASVGISILSGLGLGAVSAISDYRRSFDLALENHGRIIQAALPQLESAYWDLDLAAVQATLDRLAETPLVQEVRIRDQVFSAEDLASVAVPDLAATSDRPLQPVWPLSRIVPADWLVATHDLALYGRAGPDPIASLSVRLNYAGLYDDLGYRALSLMATTMLQALLIAGLLFLLIRDRIISPLNALAKAARSHRESGTFRLDGLPVTRGVGSREDEISVLARDFGRTVMRMERYRDHLQEEVDQRTAELVVARNDALAASRAKSAFLANMSHEMRTPLNAITGLSDLVLAEGQTPATRRHINDMRHAARQLLGSIDQVLDLSKLEAGQIRYAHAPYHPVEVFDEVIAQTRVLAAGKPISVEGDLDPAIPPVLLGDGQKITQILLNLTSNAVKFTESGRIRLHLHRREGWLRITVADTGSGIATAQRAAVFSPFTQGNESASRNVSGTGLGLTIARQMAEGMGGALTLASRAGRGSLFVLRLPLVAAAEGAPPDRAPLDCPALDLPEGRLKRRIGHMLARLGAGPAPTPGLVLGLREGGLRLARGVGETLDLPLVLTHRELADALVPGGGAAGAALRQVDARLTGRRILLIEDRAINRAVVESLLARAGAQVMPVAGGQEALALAGQGGRPPDLILTDLHMPEMDGFDAIAALRRAGLAGVPVVALSADVSSATRQSCRAAGFDGFVAKPLTAEALLDEIARVLRLPPPAHPPGPSDAAHPPAGPPPGPAAVLDRGLLLRHAGGDPALAADWLGRLPDEIAGWCDLLGREGPDPGVLHLIAGSAAQVGALALAAACRAPDPDLPLLLAQLDALLAELAPDPRPPARSCASSRPSSPPRDPLALRLQACRHALAGHEMRGFDLLEALLPDLPPQAAEGLRQAARRLDFRAAQAGLAALQP